MFPENSQLDREILYEETPHDDLCWLAFRYSHGEMTPDEVEAFEELLAEDQAAREALADAVELSAAVETVCAAGPSPAGKLAAPSSVARRSRWLSPLGWMAVGAAACLAVMLAARPWVASPRQKLAEQGADGLARQAVATVDQWNSNVLQELREDYPDSPLAYAPAPALLDDPSHLDDAQSFSDAPREDVFQQIEEDQGPEGLVALLAGRDRRKDDSMMDNAVPEE